MRMEEFVEREKHERNGWVDPVSTVLDWQLVEKYGATDISPKIRVDGEIRCSFCNYSMWWELRRMHLEHFVEMHGLHSSSKSTYKFLDLWRVKLSNRPVEI